MHYQCGLGSGGGREYPLQEQFLEGIESIHLGMEVSGGYIFQGTRQEIDSTKNAIFRVNSCLGDAGVAEFDCVGVEGGLGVFINEVVVEVVIEGRANI